MAQHKSWTMSAVVVGTYLCAVCFAGGPAVGGRTGPARPTAARMAELPATRPAFVLPAMVTVEDVAGQ